ncbi:hypothetical protein [Palaeococcus sp. (in: euryarchaeotes)]
MRKILPIILVLALSSLILIGSSGTFVYFEAGREVKVAVVPHDKEYLAFTCYEGYAATVVVDKNSSKSFGALTVKNYLNELKEVWIRLDPDYSDLPGDMEVWIESEDGIEREIASGDSYTFMGDINVGDVPEGEYVVPITFYARWNGGDAVVETCPLRIIVVGGPTIEKILLEGNTTVPVHTYEEWKVRILVTNDGLARNLTIEDTIPNEFDVDLGRTSASAGTYEFVAMGNGNGATKLTWNVSLEAGESAYLDMLIYTKKNPAGKQEFTSCGRYPLNDGATIKGFDIRSNSLVVQAVGCDDGKCCVRVHSYLKGCIGKLFLPEGTARDYTTGVWIKNKGSERDFLVVQRIGSQFNVTDYTPSKGTVEFVPLQNGKTLVKWRLHLVHNEKATLEMDEHTDGIMLGNRKSKLYLLASKPIVKNCNQVGGSRINVLVFKRGGCTSECFGSKNSLELLDMEDYEDEN